jgi:signal transduction histidine kinase/CheY-like chemotaxis protein
MEVGMTDLATQDRATDDNPKAISLARTGRYGKQLQRLIPENALSGYAIPDRKEFRIAQVVRESCIFATHRILQDPPFSNLDFICCHSPELLIPARLRRVIPIFHFSLRDKGRLLLGTENDVLAQFGHLFSKGDDSGRSYSRAPGSSMRQPAVELPFLKDKQPKSSRTSRKRKLSVDTKRQLAAAREELRIINQDLSNFFEELEDRNRDLSRISDDLSNLFASIRLPLIMVDSNLRIRRFNTAAQESFKLIPEDSGRSIEDVQCNLRVSDLGQLISNVIETGNPHEQEAQDRTGHWFILRIRPYLTSDNKTGGAVIGLVDIDAIKQSRDREQQARAEAEAANRMKDDFLATLSHELRTPLTPMLGWVKILRSEQINEDQKLKGLDIIERSVKAQRKLIEDLLDISRIVTGKFELKLSAVDLPKILESAIETVLPLARQKSLSMDIAMDPLEMTSGDPDRLRQAFWNLLVNSVKFTPAGGVITIRLKKSGSSAAVEIKDNGEGISDALLPHLFERFRQGDSSTTRRYGGLGIGLSLVRTIVDLHGGSVQAASDGVGKGSTFTIQLPLRAPAECSSPKVSATFNSVASLYGTRILVVDDHNETRDFLRESLSAANANVVCACDAVDAMKKFNEFTPDVFVGDIGMPNEDGLSLIRKIRGLEQEKSLKPVASIALTAFAMSSDRTRCLQAGYDHHMAKPVSIQELIGVITRLTEKDALAGSPRPS